jgi:hypothetical protein
MYAYHNIEAGRRNYCFSEKIVCTAYSERMFIALGNQHAMQIRHILICNLPDSTIFCLHYLMNGAIFENIKVIEHKMCFDFFYNFCLKYFSF